MVDREKVRSELKSALEWCEPEDNPNGSIAVKIWAVMDALSLLKEQEAKSPVVRKKNGYWDYVCPTCGSRDEELFREWNYCPFCGQKVKWE